MDGRLESLGQAGAPHCDGGDSPVALTCMFNLSRSHPDIDPELFTVLGLGFCCILPELSSLYFSGLYLHTGTQPVYSLPRKSKSKYIRVTCILYPSQAVIHGQGSLAFATTPKTSDLMDEDDIEKAVGMKGSPEKLKEFLRSCTSTRNLLHHYSEMRPLW